MRARITIPDLMFYAIAVAVVAGLYPVYTYLIGLHGYSGDMALILNTLGPAFVAVLLTTVLAKAAVGPK